MSFGYPVEADKSEAETEEGKMKMKLGSDFTVAYESLMKLKSFLWVLIMSLKQFFFLTLVKSLREINDPCSVVEQEIKFN